MKDRVPLYPGRVKLTPVSGQENTYDMVRADGPTQEGTALSKATLLSDETAAALELTQSDPTVNDALYALSQKGATAVVQVMGDVGTTVTMVRGRKTLTGTVGSDGYATLYPNELGDWSITFVYEGTQKVKAFTLEVIGIFTVYPFVGDESLEETSWGEISMLSKAGICDKVFKVGDKKNITVNGVIYPVQIIGFNHDTLSDGTKAGVTFQLVDCLNTTYGMDNTDYNTHGWEGCRMRNTTLNNTIYGQLNSDLKAVIKAANKVTSVGDASSDLETTSDNLFLLSEVEIFGSAIYTYEGEGSQYEWYSAGNTRVKNANGSATYWWERSPGKNSSETFSAVDRSGSVSNGYAANDYGVSFAFCV